MTLTEGVIVGFVGTRMTLRHGVGLGTRNPAGPLPADVSASFGVSGSGFRSPSGASGRRSTEASTSVLRGSRTRPSEAVRAGTPRAVRCGPVLWIRYRGHRTRAAWTLHHGSDRGKAADSYVVAVAAGGVRPGAAVGVRPESGGRRPRAVSGRIPSMDRWKRIGRSLRITVVGSWRRNPSIDR